MRKNLFFIAIVSVFAVLSCRNNDGDVQQIDQIIHLYIDSAGKDMLNNKIAGSYTNVSLIDLYGKVDNAPVNYSPKKNADTVRYIEYIAGAKRRLVDSSDVNNKIYQSKIALKLTVKKQNSTMATFTDVLLLNYVNSAASFQVKQAFYNGNLVFTKVAGQPNIIKIHK